MRTTIAMKPKLDLWTFALPMLQCQFVWLWNPLSPYEFSIKWNPYIEYDMCYNVQM
jgi:hypothetical protein